MLPFGSGKLSSSFNPNSYLYPPSNPSNFHKHAKLQIYCSPPRFQIPVTAMEAAMMSSGGGIVRALDNVPIRRTMAAGRWVKNAISSYKMALSAEDRVRFNLELAGKSRRIPITAVCDVRSNGIFSSETESPRKSTRHTVSGCRPQLFVGLPLASVVSDGSNVNHAKAIAAGLKALKLLGVDGVEVPVWWGIVEKEKMGEQNWSGYFALAKMIQETGLKMHVSFNFHASPAASIPLPTWVSAIGKSNPDVYFTDKEGRRNMEYLSLAIDDLPLLGGKSPLQVYEAFLRSFEASFRDLICTTITDISIGLGPDGELRYPSLLSSASTGVGQFQCYDKHMLSQLQRHADECGNHNWGLSGPHDAPNYDQTPESGNFFKDANGSWETPYGDFFLKWYSAQLLNHGDRVLSMASKVFHSQNSHVGISGKIPLMHSWYKTRSHPSELTAGYYHTDLSRDGYDSTSKMFSRNCCKMILPGMELPGENPQLLLSEMKMSCERHGVGVSGENSSILNGFGKIKENIGGGESMDCFTYQRMGASFFSPEHWPQFTEFVRSVGQPEVSSDDLPGSMTLRSTKANAGRKMQAAA